jgi:hypothetical protein
VALPAAALVRPNERKLSSKEKGSLRQRVVRWVEADFYPEDLDINLLTVYRWLEKYHFGGKHALQGSRLHCCPT